MKNLLLLLAVTFTGITVSFAQKPGKTDTLSVKTRIYCDHCLECGSCAGNVNMGMAGLYGIKKVTILPEAQTIVVAYNPKKMTPDKIRGAIASAGFDADHIPAKPEAVAKLDGCCQKK